MYRHPKPAALSLFFLLVLLAGGCRKDADMPSVEPEDILKNYPEGLSWSPENPKPDEPFVINFRAPVGSPLYGAKEDLYAHLGVVNQGEWQYVPAAWDENTPKMKMVSLGENVWRLSMKEGIRTFFGAKAGVPITKIGVVIRNADGSKKAFPEDRFIPVTDPLFGTLPKAVEASLPAGVREGININPLDKSVTLVLADTDKNGSSPYTNAFVIGDFNDWTRLDRYAMKRDTEKELWWITLDDIAGGTHLFQYELFGAGDRYLRLADPYTEKIVTPEDKEIPASVYPGATPYPEGKTYGTISTFDTDPDEYFWQYDKFSGPKAEDLLVYEILLRDFTPTGDLNGAKKRLPLIKEMGFNAVELMPVQEFRGNDSWGYNPTYYFALDKAYGTKKDYQAFTDECHRLGLAVILDVVFNHMDSDSPFVRLYADDKGNPLPNNPFFNVRAPHPYSVFNDFNHEAERTQELVTRSLDFLMDEYRVDGFRFDLSKGFTQTVSDEKTVGNYDEKRVSILTRYADFIKTIKPNAYVILEHFAGEEEEKELAESGMILWRNLNNAFAQAGMGYSENSDFTPLLRSNLPLWSDMGYMESHDEERVAYKQKTYGVSSIKDRLDKRVDRLMLGTAFFLLTPGPKMVWQYGEYGYDVSIETNGRTGRKPVWTTELEEPERVRLREGYKLLAQVRHRYPDLFDEGAAVERNVSVNDWTTPRSIRIANGADELLLIGNFNPLAPVSYTTSGDFVHYTDLSTPVRRGTTLTLAPGTYLILVKR